MDTDEDVEEAEEIEMPKAHVHTTFGCVTLRVAGGRTWSVDRGP